MEVVDRGRERERGKSTADVRIDSSGIAVGKERCAQRARDREVVWGGMANAKT